MTRVVCQSPQADLQPFFAGATHGAAYIQHYNYSTQCEERTNGRCGIHGLLLQFRLPVLDARRKPFIFKKCGSIIVAVNQCTSRLLYAEPASLFPSSKTTRTTGGSHASIGKAHLRQKVKLLLFRLFLWIGRVR